MSSAATRFREILDGLRAAIGAHVARNRAYEAVFALLWTRIGRMAARFEALYAKWQSGTLPGPRPSRADRPAKPREPQPRLPRGRAWVVAQVGYHAAGRASQLQHLLADPAMAAFLQAAPQAGRILRPLCHILGIDSPSVPKTAVNTTPLAPADDGRRRTEQDPGMGQRRRPGRSGARPRAASLPVPSPSPIVPPPRFSPA